MTKQTEALKMAHKTFMQLNERHPRRDNGDGCFDKELKAINEALDTEQVRKDDAQPSQKPVAWCDSLVAPKAFATNLQQRCHVPLYTHPAPSWQGLSDDVVASIWMHEAVPMNGQDFKRVYRAIEQALKDKNS